MGMKESSFIDNGFDDRSSSQDPKHAFAWVEESFTFDRPVGRQIVTSKNSAYIGNNFGKRHTALLLGLCCIVFAAILVRLVSLQLIQGEALYLVAEGNRQRIVPIPAERGLIYDRNGKLLTNNVPNFSLALTPQHLPRDKNDRQELVRRLADMTKRPEDDIWRLLDEYGAYSYESIIVQENLDYETALKVQIAAADLPGIHIVRGSKRLYLHGTPTTMLSLSHLIGYEGKLSREELDALYADGYLPSDVIGKTGIEKTYESYLRGVYGKKRVEVDALGREQSVLAEVAPDPGYHLVLSVDADMQKELETLIRRSLAANKKNRAVAVALDPRNGEILALVSFPPFDNNDFSGGISLEQYTAYLVNSDQPLFNRAIGGTYPSGSTIKPAIAAAALEEAIITPRSVFLSAGGLRIGEWFFPDWQPGGHGWTNVVASLANSVNTFYYYIGGGFEQFHGLGVGKIQEYLARFGFGSELGIDIPGEVSGFLPDEAWKRATKGEEWYIGDTYNLSIGQGDLLVTPLQIAAMTAAIANGGSLYRPHLVTSIRHPVSQKTIEVTPTMIRSNVVNRQHIDTVRLGMRACVGSGSCRRLADLPISVAGKTGTAEWREDRENHGWFTSFAPYDNPKIALTILVEEGGQGSRIAAPIAKEFYYWWWQYQQDSDGVDSSS